MSTSKYVKLAKCRSDTKFGDIRQLKEGGSSFKMPVVGAAQLQIAGSRAITVFPLIRLTGL